MQRHFRVRGARQEPGRPAVVRVDERVLQVIDAGEEAKSL
jgi:hypothetical protein